MINTRNVEKFTRFNLTFDYQILLFRCDKNDEGAFFEDGRFYPINIQRFEGEGKC